MTYWDLLLRQDDSTILASDAYGHDIGGGDGLEGIFYGSHNMSAPCGSIKPPVFRAGLRASPFVLVDRLGRLEEERMRRMIIPT